MWTLFNRIGSNPIEPNTDEPKQTFSSRIKSTSHFTNHKADNFVHIKPIKSVHSMEQVEFHTPSCQIQSNRNTFDRKLSKSIDLNQSQIKKLLRIESHPMWPNATNRIQWIQSNATVFNQIEVSRFQPNKSIGCSQMKAIAIEWMKTHQTNPTG